MAETTQEETLSQTKITGLTYFNVDALRRVFPEAIERGQLEVTASTATFKMPAREAHIYVRNAVLGLPGRSHPKASLHAVVRKLAKALAKATA